MREAQIIRIGTGTTGYKYPPADLAAVRASLEAPQLQLSTQGRIVSLI